MGFPMNLYVHLCLVPKIRFNFPKIGFELDLDRDSDEWLITLHEKDGDRVITEKELNKLPDPPKE